MRSATAIGQYNHPAHRPDRCRNRHRRSQRDFEVQPQAAHVQVHRTHQAELTVDQHALGMQQTAFELINSHARFQQFGEEGAAGPAYHRRVVVAWDNNADLHPAQGSGADSMQQVVAWHKVGVVMITVRAQSKRPSAAPGGSSLQGSRGRRR
ncbi:hypothetical protein NA32_09775 [Streptococcus hongkongensis]|nr:hypothetical protein NA32_09775 [Streptococcus hongkongensis]